MSYTTGVSEKEEVVCDQGQGTAGSLSRCVGNLTYSNSMFKITHLNTCLETLDAQPTDLRILLIRNQHRLSNDISP